MPKQLNIIDDLLRVANPEAMAATPEHVPAMIGGGNRNGLSGNTDHLPMAYRAGAQTAPLPSRMGNRLYYRDGRVEVIK